LGYDRLIVYGKNLHLLTPANLRFMVEALWKPT